MITFFVKEQDKDNCVIFSRKIGNNYYKHNDKHNDMTFWTIYCMPYIYLVLVIDLPYTYNWK